jgi:hypothetical protein
LKSCSKPLIGPLAPQQREIEPARIFNRMSF